MLHAPEVKDPPWLLGKFLFILALQWKKLG